MTERERRILKRQNVLLVVLSIMFVLPHAYQPLGYLTAAFGVVLLVRNLWRLRRNVW